MVLGRGFVEMGVGSTGLVEMGLRNWGFVEMGLKSWGLVETKDSVGTLSQYYHQ